MDWTSVKDKYPPKNEIKKEGNIGNEISFTVSDTKKYLVTYEKPKGGYSVDCYLWDKNEGKFMGTFSFSHRTVTHWCELPEGGKQ